MANPIVIVNTSQQVAPSPSTLQRTGAFVSQGSTTLPAGTFALLVQPSSLTPILTGANTVTAASYAAGVVTLTLAQPHGIPLTDVVIGTVVGMAPAAYNGAYQITATTTTQLTYPLAANPGAVSVYGSFTLYDVAETLGMCTTYFAQGNSNSVYVLELGAGTPTQGIAALTTFLTVNPNMFYAFLVPREWDDYAGPSGPFATLAAAYQNPNSKLYFFVTTKLSTYAQYTNLQKCVLATLEAPSLNISEFTAAALFYNALNYNPSATNRMTPFEYTFLYGVTPYPTFGNAALLTTLKAANINFVGTGAEGGISNTLIVGGKFMDGNPYNYWYGADYVSLNLDLGLSNEIINGSNNPQAPLDYDQPGINRLYARSKQLLDTAVTFGVIQGGYTLAAQPFSTYVVQNPGDYKIGVYKGLSAAVVPQRGFDQILFYLNVSNFPGLTVNLA